MLKKQKQDVCSNFQTIFFIKIGTKILKKTIFIIYNLTKVLIEHKTIIKTLFKMQKTQ